MSERKSFREKFGYDPGDYFENGKYNPLLLMSKIKVAGSRSGWKPPFGGTTEKKR